MQKSHLLCFVTASPTVESLQGFSDGGDSDEVKVVMAVVMVMVVGVITVLTSQTMHQALYI